MEKGDRIGAYVRSLGLDHPDLDPCYLAYFICFNRQEYYEAHDVLEHLWLQGTASDHAFYKGLIQFAGAFVHLKKQREHPDHPTHGRRIRPATRLFDLASRHLAPYRPHHLSLDVETVLGIAETCVREIAASDYTVNPWSPATAPVVMLDPPS